MKDQLARFLPAVVGVLIGLLIFNPPSFLERLGPARYLVTLAAAILALVVFVALTIARNLPARVALRPLDPSAVPPDVRRIADAVVALGFFGAGPALEVGVSPAAIMVPLVNPGERTYSAVYRTGTAPAVTALDFVSILEGHRGGLTSCSDRRGSTLPAGPGEFRQILPGLTPAALLEAHREGLAHLHGRGLPARGVTASAFQGDFVAAIARQRRTFLASPIVNTLIAIWRSASGRTPHFGRVQDQAIARAEIERLVTGARTMHA